MECRATVFFVYRLRNTLFVICREEAQELADKLKKITVADIIESMKVTFVPFFIQDGQTCRIYKLEMTLHVPEHLRTIIEYSSEDWEEILEIVFVRELEDAIQNHILLLSKISGIKNFTPDSQPKASNETDENLPEKRSQREEEDDDNGGADDGEHGEGVEDFGLDAHKRKLQATDEMDYEDGCDDEVREADLSDGDESEIDEEENEVEIGKDGEIGVIDANDEMPGSPLEEAGDLAKPKSKEKKTKSGSQIRKKRKVRAEMVKKETDRAIFVSAKGFHFEVHFRFTDNEPHILLSQVLLVLLVVTLLLLFISLAS